MPNIKQSAKFLELANKQKFELPANAGKVLKPLIDDIIFDIQLENEIVTERIYSALANALQTSEEKVRDLVNAYVSWLLDSSANLSENVFIQLEKYEIPEDDEDLEDLGELELDEEDIEDNEFEIQDDESRKIDEASSTLARIPILRGKALKKRKAKANIMSKLNQDPIYMQAKEKLMMIAKREAKRIARENGIKATLVDVTKIIVRK